MSQAEVYLWLRLRRDQLGVRFARQRPIGPYIADFYCHEAALVVEIDGRQHDQPEHRAHDAQRDRWMTARGLRVVRIAATELVRNTDSFAEWLGRVARERATERKPQAPPPASKTRPPPPRCGGG
jgi:very-short-patch-repair endonuclease